MSFASQGQTDYPTGLTAAFAGMSGDLGLDEYVRSMVSTDTNDIPFGVAVVQDTADGTARMPSGSDDKMVGIAQFSQSYARDPNGDLGANGLHTGAMLNVKEKGRIWVTVETGCAAEDRPFIRYSANGGNTQTGAFRNADDSGHCIDVTDKGKYVTSCGAGGIALLEIDCLAK